MKKLGLFAIIIAMLLTSSVMLSSCQRQNTDNVSSDIVSEEITSSDTSTSEPEKEEESSKAENSSKPETSSKPKESSKPSVSSKPKPAVSSKTNNPEPKPVTDPLEYMQPHELFKGKWKATVDIVPQLIKEGYDLQGSALVNVTYEFFGNGTGAYTMDKSSFLSAMKSVLNQTLQAEMTANNLTQQDFEAQIGMTYDEYISLAMTSLADYPTSYSFYCMFDDECVNIQTGENTYDGLPYKFKTADEFTLNEYGQHITYTRVK